MSHSEYTRRLRELMVKARAAERIRAVTTDPSYTPLSPSAATMVQLYLDNIRDQIKELTATYQQQCKQRGESQ